MYKSYLEHEVVQNYKNGLNKNFCYFPLAHIGIYLFFHKNKSGYHLMMDIVQKKSSTMEDLNNSRQQNRVTCKCEICDKEFKCNNKLNRHFNGVHNSIKEHQCNICQMIFNLQRELSLHVKIACENCP